MSLNGKSKAYMQGYLAYTKNIQVNPFVTGQEFTDWTAGWWDKCNECLFVCWGGNVLTVSEYVSIINKPVSMEMG